MDILLIYFIRYHLRFTSQTVYRYTLFTIDNNSSNNGSNDLLQNRDRVENINCARVNHKWLVLSLFHILRFNTCTLISNLLNRNVVFVKIVR